MFDTLVLAEQAIRERFPVEQVEVLKQALIPTLVFEVKPDQTPVPGGTRFGGTPDLPDGVEWPRTTPPANAEEIANRLHPDAAKEVLAHYAKKLPYAFFAQIDLAEAARLGDVASDLPATGRLYFFYDMAGGLDAGTRSAKVFWNDAPASALKPQQFPDDLAAAHKERKEYFQDPPLGPNAGTPFWGQPREMSLKLTYSLPDVDSLAMERNDALKAFVAHRDYVGNPHRDEYSKFFERFDAFFDESNSIKRLQLLGSPLPEQSDPLHYASGYALFNRELLPEEWDTHKTQLDADVATWQLLYQHDVRAFEQVDFSEGTVYFLIRKEDLKARNFEKVVAVYQQT